MSSAEFDMAAAADRAWAGFRGRLADRLAELEDDEVVFVEVESGVDDDELVGAAPYLQLVGWGAGVVRGEVVSNAYLDERYALAPAEEQRLVDLGWSPPTHAAGDDSDAGSANFYIDLERREADRLAVMAVRTLREVFGCAHPAFLQAAGLLPEAVEERSAPQASGDTEEPLAVFPESPEELQELVDRALAPMFDGDLRHDEDGDVPVVCGQSVVFVRVGGVRPAVELYCELVHEIGDLERAAQEVAILNTNHPLARFRIADDRIIASYRIVAWPFAPAQLRAALAQMGDDIDDLARDVALRVDGRRFAEPPETLDTYEGASETDPDDDALAGLLELLHDGAVPPAQVAALFDNDRHRLIQQLVWLRTGRDHPGDHDLELVLGQLRGALRFVADAEALPTARRPLPPRPERSRQLTLLPDEAETLDAGVWGLEESS